jgi:hypothetical protein
MIVQDLGDIALFLAGFRTACDFRLQLSLHVIGQFLAHKLILSDDLPEIDAWKNECADCIHADLCNGNNLPAVNCGSCCNIGSPACGLCAKENMHIFHPNFLTNSGFEIVNVDAENMVIEYDSFYSVNNKLIRLKDKNKPCLTSQELKLTWANDMKLDDPFIKLMTRFNGTIDSLSKDAD